MPVTLVDSSEATRMVIQLRLNRSDTGRFDFFVVGVGDYAGQVGLKPNGSRLDLEASVNARFVAAQPGAPQSKQLVAVKGWIAPKGHEARVDLVSPTAQRTFHLATNLGDAKQAGEVASQVTTASNGRDFAGLYELLAPELRSGTTKTKFVADLNSQQVPGQPVLGLAGPGHLSVGSDGYSYFQQPATLTTAGAGGAQRTLTTRILLILHAGRWYLVAIEKPT